MCLEVKLRKIELRTYSLTYHWEIPYALQKCKIQTLVTRKFPEEMIDDLHRIFSGFRVAPKSSFAAKWPLIWDWKRPEWIMPRPSRHPCISGKWIASHHNLYSRWIVTCLRPICPLHREERPSPKGLWLQWCYRPSHYPKKESQKTGAEYRCFIIIH